MPLVYSANKDAVGKNIRASMKEGKSFVQARAIALSIQAGARQQPIQVKTHSRMNAGIVGAHRRRRR